MTRSKSGACPVSYNSGTSTTASGWCAQAGGNRAVDGRVDNRLEIAPRAWIGEDERRQFLTVDGAVGGEHVAKSCRDRLGRLGPGRFDAVRQQVGVEARHAALPELVQHVALAGCYSTGEGYSEHSVKPIQPSPWQPSSCS